MKILIAEDEEITLKTLELRLKRDGHEVILARDGREALSKIEEHSPDLVISDIMMPYVSGLEIIAAIKENYPDRKIPIIILSGMGQEDTVLEAFQLGADDFITKPFSPNELTVRVRRFDMMKAK
ncbi:response regulator [Pedobacter sp. LMG 31464]|uniref:Response regulator n=1 Tax=Pedobacter planticolens TaxID=2679964 RepID=A0A923DWS5_9SPHI|nr:response regulator [Pedobacter planticolens]MBB2145431.1 response regulator [Pedobacter planticolens]